MLAVGTKYNTRNGKRKVTILGDKTLGGVKTFFCLICSDGVNRSKDGKVFNPDMNHPLDLITL